MPGTTSSCGARCAPSSPGTTRLSATTVSTKTEPARQCRATGIYCRSMVSGEIGQVPADRTYDTRTCYESVLERGAVVTIPPRRNATCRRGADPPEWRVARDATLRAIAEQGRYAWRASSGCTRQSPRRERGLAVQDDTRRKTVLAHVRKSAGRGRDQVWSVEPNGGARSAPLREDVLKV